MGPHSILRVRGGQPIGGGPSFDQEDLRNPFAFAEESSEDRATLTAVKEEPIRAGQSRFPVGPNLVLGPLRNDLPLHIRIDTQDAQDAQNVQDAQNETTTPIQRHYPHDSEESDLFRNRLPDSFTHSHSNTNTTDPFREPEQPKPQPRNRMDESLDEYQMVVAGLVKTYTMGKVKVPVLKGVDLNVREGEFLSIVGQSGSGKSTLLHLLGTLDFPDRGTIHFEGQRIDNLSSGQRDILRNRFIGMIFQFYHLLPELSTLENVLAPLMVRHGFWNYLFNRATYRKRAEELLEAVGLGHRMFHKPNELSGGEMQRTAIARALISEPQILLADEPTGNLDAKTAREILQLLKTLNHERKLTIVMVTHDLSIAQEAERTIRIVDGIIE